MPAARTLVALLLLAAAILAGCGSEDSDTGSTAPAETAGSAPPGDAEAGGTPPGADIELCREAGGGVLLLRATGVPCRTAKRVAKGWKQDPECRPGGGESRSACSIDGYRCQAVVAEQGTSISCARPGRSVAFVVAR